MQSYVSEHELREIYTNIPLLRHTIERIDPATTVVMCRAKDINAAIEHYGQYCSFLPEFYILDWNNYSSIGDKKKYSIFSAREWYRYINKNTCLYIPPTPLPWTDFTPCIQMMRDIVGENFFVDAIGSRDCTWIHSASIDTNIIDCNWNTIVKLYNILEDESSKNIFISAIKSRVEKNIGYFPISIFPDYHHPSVSIKDGDFIIDAGIGEALEPSFYFSKLVGKNGRVFCFEPVKDFYEKAKKRFSEYHNITIENLGLWHETSMLSFTDNFNDGSHVASLQNEPGNTVINCVSIDNYVEEKGIKCDFIKMDIEGAELDALHGAEKTLQHYRPNLAICIYHAPFTQIFTIFNYIYNLDLGYVFFIGQHTPYFNDTVLYAVSRKKYMQHCSLMA